MITHLAQLQCLRRDLTGLSPEAYAALDFAITAERVPEGYSVIDDYELARLRERDTVHQATARGDVWYWQGDGQDFPESLTCPVIMSADALRALLPGKAEGVMAEDQEDRVDVALVAYNRADYQWCQRDPDDRDEPRHRFAMRAAMAATVTTDTRLMDWLEQNGCGDIQTIALADPSRRWFDSHTRAPIGADHFPSLRALILAALVREAAAEVTP